MPNYTEEDYEEFCELVRCAESPHQMDRIEARLEQPKMIERLGKDVCDEMFERFCDECDETRAEKHESNYGEDQAREDHEQEMERRDLEDRQ